MNTFSSYADGAESNNKRNSNCNGQPAVGANNVGLTEYCLNGFCHIREYLRTFVFRVFDVV
jgi:hypothetical protein